MPTDLLDHYGQKIIVNIEQQRKSELLRFRSVPKKHYLCSLFLTKTLLLRNKEITKTFTYFDETVHLEYYIYDET